MHQIVDQDAASFLMSASLDAVSGTRLWLRLTIMVALRLGVLLCSVWSSTGLLPRINPSLRRFKFLISLDRCFVLTATLCSLIHASLIPLHARRDKPVVTLCATSIALLRQQTLTLA